MEQDQRGFVKGVGTALVVGRPQGVDGKGSERRKLGIIGNGHGTASSVGE